MTRVLANRVHCLGLASDIPDVLGATDVFVLSSDWQGNPLSVMEAMASGLPIVSTDAGGVPTLFESGKEGFIVARREAQALGNSMASLLRDRETRVSLGRAAARRAKQHFDTSTMSQASAELYETLVNPP